MNKESRYQSDDNYIEQKLQPVFGYNEEQLLAEYDRAASEPDDPELITPKDELRKLLTRVREEEEKKQSEHKVLRLKTVARPLILVAALGVILMASGIGASGMRELEYWVTKQGGNGSNLAWDNNADNLIKIDAEEDAYRKIKEELGIDVIKLEYMPGGMKFGELEINPGQAKLEFLYKGEYLYVFQTLFGVENSVNTRGDILSCRKVDNPWLKKEIPIEKNVIDDNRVEFGAGIETGKAYYYISGIIEEEEFVKIINNLKYYE